MSDILHLLIALGLGGGVFFLFNRKISVEMNKSRDLQLQLSMKEVADDAHLLDDAELASRIRTLIAEHKSANSKP